jgi:hypothetical protein
MFVLASLCVFLPAAARAELLHATRAQGRSGLVPLLAKKSARACACFARFAGAGEPDPTEPLRCGLHSLGRDSGAERCILRFSPTASPYIRSKPRQCVPVSKPGLPGRCPGPAGSSHKLTSPAVQAQGPQPPRLPEGAAGRNRTHAPTRRGPGWTLHQPGQGLLPPPVSSNLK